MTKALVGFLALTACYRDQPAAIQGTTTEQPLVLAQAASCGPDDRDHPVVDVFPEGRLRSHATGSLAARGAQRPWGGPAIPDYVPASIGTLDLFLLDEVQGGHLAFYREPYGAGQCNAGGTANCRYEAHLYTKRSRSSGGPAWTVALHDLMSRPSNLEIQDIRYAGGVLYFNEACQSYSSGANGQCSSLVAVDPMSAKVLWRTPPLTSNGRFAVRGCYIVAGYGFTGEPDNIFLVERARGKVVQKVPVSTAPQQYTLQGHDRLHVELYAGTLRRFELRGFDTTAGQLVPLDPPESFAGNNYGGMTYGGRAP